MIMQQVKVSACRYIVMYHFCPKYQVVKKYYCFKKKSYFCSMFQTLAKCCDKNRILILYHVVLKKQMIKIRLSACRECFYDLVSISFIGDKKSV